MNDDFDNIIKNKFKQNINIHKSFNYVIKNSIQIAKAQDNSNKSYSLKKLAIAFSLFFVLVGVFVKATPLFQTVSYPEIGHVTKSLYDAVENGYIQYIDMNYAYSNDIGVKVNYVIMSNYNLNILFDFNFKKELPEDVSDIKVGNLFIYDENNNIICCSYNEKLAKKFLKSKNIKYSGNAVYMSLESGWSAGTVEITPSHIKYIGQVRSIKGFPNSKKLFISFDYISINDSEKPYVRGNWSLELDLSEKFYDRETKEYVLAEPNEFIKLKQATVTDTLMQITYIPLKEEIYSTFINKLDYYIIDANGQKYDLNIIGAGRIVENENEIVVTFPINLSNATDELIFHIDNHLEFKLKIAPE